VQSYPLEEISVPTLIINARDDAMSAYANADLAAPRIRDSRLASIHRWADGRRLIVVVGVRGGEGCG
jgi:pimeloyl-ACP methyl ester carboxylesterase